MSRSVKPVSSYFGENIFDLPKMHQMLPKNAYDKIVNVIQRGDKLDKDTANIVAIAMKDWAMSKGCTHYTHWFQPLTGYTAEKHDSFIEYDYGNGGKIMESFTGKQLTQGEPDASSFPSGGIRATFEARGYTIWDPTSPVFVLEYPHGNTLCIPTVFVSYTGETLDKKAPLLRSINALNISAMKILAHFKNPATKVFSTLGVEQEYFLIDREYYHSRPDLKQTGRTLFGRTPAKHQQLEDQYFGNIPERAFAFMTEIETEAYKLGIPLKTRHNEVAPNQFEVAPIYEDVNVAIDHNQILMDLMDRIAQRHGLAVLLHEKPFANVNGSGKHCNWALSTDKGENLLNPGKTPQSNLQFLIFLVATIKAVYKHSRLLRASIATAANDHRLGANEAPPAIISVFLGELLTRVLEDLEKGKVTENTDEAWLSIGIDKIPDIPKDNTDRNRTSPFAFTGNKFEFRAVGSSQSPSTPITVLNTAMAESLDDIRSEIEKLTAKGTEFNVAVVEVLRKEIVGSKKVLFAGDGYSEAWQKEAAKRGLPNLKSAPEAIETYRSKLAKDLFTKHKVYNERELDAILHIDLENYIKQIDIEARVAKKMALTMYYPAAVSYVNELCETVNGLRSVIGKKHASIASLTAVIADISIRMSRIQANVKSLDRLLEMAQKQKDITKKAEQFVAIKSHCEKIRIDIDELEIAVASDFWPVPKYADMIIGL
ncbi:MAG: glutamine synthetase III family protein [Bacteroidota bacterium]